MSEKATNPKEEHEENLAASETKDAKVQTEDQQNSEPTPEEYKKLLSDLNDRLLRAVAEMQNTKKRADIDIQKARQFSIESFARDVIGVLDNLYRASESITDEQVKQNPILQNFKDGIEITKKELLNIFDKNNIKRIDPKGEKFNPDFHQAVTQVPTNEQAPDTIIDVVQVGYTIKDRVIRPAMVTVSTAQ